MTAAPLNSHILQLNNLFFERNNSFLFEKINCSLQSGEALQVRGANGSGKSTLLRMVAGYIPAEPNTLLWNQLCFSKLENFQQQVHYIGHQNALRAGLTVFENLKLYCALSGTNNFSRIQPACERVGLSPYTQTFAGLLSAGQRRRLALARLLLHVQPVWILDEPTTALDLAGIALLNELLQNHLHQGGIAIVATHQDLTGQTKTLELGGQNA
jgi:heme exporter protein A